MTKKNHGCTRPFILVVAVAHAAFLVVVVLLRSGGAKQVWHIPLLLVVGGFMFLLPFVGGFMFSLAFVRRAFLSAAQPKVLAHGMTLPPRRLFLAWMKNTASFNAHPGARGGVF